MFRYDESRAGTGLLSMMAARALAAAGGEGRGSVSACESYLPMGKLTRRVLRANGMENKVKVFHKRSDELGVGVELDSRPDILVTLLILLYPPYFASELSHTIVLASMYSYPLMLLQLCTYAC
jgi:hypothetical protein